jgi:hypothetical protein
MSDIFLSYAREDASRVSDLADGLTELGWSVWWDDRIRAAAEFDDAIERELDSAGCVIVVWSRSSVASGWVRAEAGAANDQGKLVPTRFESDVVPPLRFRQLNTATLGSASLSAPSGDTLGMLAEIARLTGKAPANVDPSLLEGRTGTGSSGARTVTAGKWRITTRFLGAKGRYNLDLHPNGTVSGNGSWFISRADFAGRWYYDAGQDVLQLETSGGISNGMETLRVPITEWIDDHTAKCTLLRRKATLERMGG